MIKSAVFDIGGTLMEYKGMPCVWVDYYENGFLHVCEKTVAAAYRKEYSGRDGNTAWLQSINKIP